MLHTRCTVRGACGKAWCTSLETKGTKHATQAIMPRSAALAQNMNIIHLKTQASDSTHGTQQDPLKNAPPKPTVQEMTQPTPGVAWTQAWLGHGSAMVATLQNHPRMRGPEVHLRTSPLSSARVAKRMEMGLGNRWAVLHGLHSAFMRGNSDGLRTRRPPSMPFPEALDMKPDSTLRFQCTTGPHDTKTHGKSAPGETQIQNNTKQQRFHFGTGDLTGQ